MKKLLFAALAIVAIGAAAQSASAITVFTADGTRHECDLGDFTCAQVLGTQTVYSEDPTEVENPAIVPFGDYAFLGFQN